MIACVVCVDQNYGIGNKNKLLVNIPEDMKRFKDITIDGSVVMGRKTYDSLPNKPLLDRTNIIITKKAKKRPKLQSDNTIHANMKYIQAWLSQKDVIQENNGIYIIGGGMIYKELLPFCERVYITKVFNTYDEVDTYFPNIDEMPEWEMTSSSEIKEYNGVQYQFCIYDRVDYKILNVSTHKNNKTINKQDIVITVETFNSIKTIILSNKQNVTVYVDDWDYLKNKTCLVKFIDEVQNFIDKRGENA